MTSSSSPIVGMHGLGAMGRGMAFNLQNYLSSLSPAESLRVTNRTRSNADEVVALGATWCDAIEDMVRECEVLFGVTFDDANLLETTEKIAATQGRKSGLIYVSCGTVDPATTQQASSLLAAAGVTLLSCPVFGRPDAARAKQLIAVLAGPADAKLKTKPYIDAMSRLTWDNGTEPHLANVMKLCGNFMLGSTLEVMAEAMSLADSYELPRERVLDFINLLLPPLAHYAGNMARGTFEITPTMLGFPVRGGIKDVGLAIKAAERMGQRLRVGEVVRAHFQERIDRGGEELDWASVIYAVKEDRVGK